MYELNEILIKSVDIWVSSQLVFIVVSKCSFIQNFLPPPFERGAGERVHNDTITWSKQDKHEISNLSLFSPSSRKLISDKVFQLRFNFQSSTWLIFPIWNDSLFVYRESRATLSGFDNFCDVWSRPMPRYCGRSAHFHPTKAKRYEFWAGKGWRAVQDVQHRRNNNHKRLFRRWYFGNWCRYWSYDSAAAVN